MATYSKAEMADAIAQMFQHNDRSRFLPMLGDSFVLKVPKSLPYGGEFSGAKAFDEFYGRISDGGDYWESFVTSLDQVIEADDYLIARITINATSKAGESTVVENLWLFTIADGQIVRAQIYADTAAALRVGVS